MAHVLARLRDVKFVDVEQALKADAPRHAEQGLHLEHLWKNLDNPGEVLFLFRADDLQRTKGFIEKTHAEAHRQNPNANLPQMTFLDDSA